jgi:hypothetical protein
MDTTALVVNATTAAPVTEISRPTPVQRFLGIAGLKT